MTSTQKELLRAAVKMIVEELSRTHDESIYAKEHLYTALMAYTQTIVRIVRGETWDEGD